MYPDTDWHGKPYYSLDAWCKNTYGRKLYKIALEAGCSCPNRDGTLGTGGCIFCSAGGSGEFAIAAAASVHAQLEEGKRLLHHKWQLATPQQNQPAAFAAGNTAPACDSSAAAADHTAPACDSSAAAADLAAPACGPFLIAYFQSYTNTYGDPNRLLGLYEEALREPEVAGISIGTRPDCLPEAILSGLDRLRQVYPAKFIWIELGLQTMHDRTAALIHRGYPYAVFEQACRTLRRHGLPVIVHTILGLPGESRDDILATMNALNALQPFGIKLQLLHVLKGTELARLYEAGDVHVLEKEEYLALVCDCVAALSPQICIHRVTGDGPGALLIAPAFSLHKRDVLNSLHARMKQLRIRQGMNYESGTYHTL